MINVIHRSRVLATTTTAAILLNACTSLPSMSDPKSYAGMDCPAIGHERDAVKENQAYHADNSSSGFWDLFGAVVEGLAAGSGKTDLASQQRAANAQLQQSHDQNKESAEAYGRRLDLLDKISAVRKCT